MSRAEEQLAAYRDKTVELRRAAAFSADAGAGAVGELAAFSVGYLMGAGIPEAAAAVAHIYRRAYPGASLPTLWDGER